MSTLTQKDVEIFFKQNGHRMVRAGYYGVNQDISIEDLYQMFKARMRIESEEQ